MGGESKRNQHLRLKELISDQQRLAFYDVRKPVVIQCDASTVGLGAVLMQEARAQYSGSIEPWPPSVTIENGTRNRHSGSKAISPCKYFRHCTDHIDSMPSHSADGTESIATDLQSLSY